ncbi:MAG: hypothetical protein U0559_09050 [Anaerolineae bacterium]
MIRGPLIDPAGVSAGNIWRNRSSQAGTSVAAALDSTDAVKHRTIIAVILAIVVYVLWRTTIGYRIRAVGLNPDASALRGHSRAGLSCCR